MPTEFVEPDDNRHEGWCSGDWTLGMISDKVEDDDDDSVIMNYELFLSLR